MNPVMSVQAWSVQARIVELIEYRSTKCPNDEDRIMFQKTGIQIGKAC